MIAEASVAQAILDFWFSAACRPKWFVKDAAFDAEITARFQPAWERAATGGFADWAQSANAALARIILLDQFPRNMFRDSPKAFASDALALAAARDAVARGHDRAVTSERRLFFYLPYEHSEELDAQRQGYDLCIANIDWPEAVTAAARHLEIIERFGRFPHRNAVLGRVGTAAELEFLQEPNSSF